MTLGGLFGTGRTFQFSRPAARPSQRLAADFFFSRTDDFSDLDTTTPANTVKMAPKKAAVRAPQENISLGPQVREGKKHLNPTIRDMRLLRRTIFAGGNTRKKG